MNTEITTWWVGGGGGCRGERLLDLERTVCFSDR